MQGISPSVNGLSMIKVKFDSRASEVETKI